jgi:hypothetical protein
MDVCDAAVAVVQAASDGLILPNSATGQAWTFTAEFALSPDYDLKKRQSKLAVFIVPNAVASTGRRGMIEDLVSIDIGVIKHLSDPACKDAEGKALVGLVEQIKTLLEAKNALILANAPTQCGYQNTVNDPVYDQDEWNKNKFLSVSTFQYYTRRARN